MSWSKLCLFQDTKLVLGKPPRCGLEKWFPFQHQSKYTTLKIHHMRSTIFVINICVYNHPFKNFRNREHEGVEDLFRGNGRETK